MFEENQKIFDEGKSIFDNIMAQEHINIKNLNKHSLF